MTATLPLGQANDRVSPIALYRQERNRTLTTIAPAPGEPPVEILGQAPGFRQVLELARRAAATHAPVFITGESGTGKECLARFIHRHSPRHAAPMVPLNCAALPEALLESELFGHRRGAFTGAVRDKPGIFEAAHNGTILLDELTEMPRTIQAKLLRVLQDGVVRPVGSESLGAKVDVRIISATNRDPASAIADGQLREDLYYRLDVVPLHLPALRDRPEDIPLLAQHFLTLYWTRHRAEAPPVLTPDALDALGLHPWRGNVRELQNTIEHLVVVLEPGSSIGPNDIPFRDLPAAERGGAPAATPATGTATQDFSDGYRPARERALADFEATYLEWFQRRAGRNISRAARNAGIERTTLYRLLERREVRAARP